MVGHVYDTADFAELGGENFLVDEVVFNDKNVEFSVKRGLGLGGRAGLRVYSGAEWWCRVGR